VNAIGTTTGRIRSAVDSDVTVAPLTPVLFDHLPDLSLPAARLR